VDKLLSTAEVADRIGVAEVTLRYWRMHGTGPRWARVGRKIKYTERDLEVWWRAQLKLSDSEQRVTRRSVQQ
jgi:DNA-binding transcriptional MerR regulator